MRKRKLIYSIVVLITLIASLLFGSLPVFATSTATLYESYTAGGDGDSDAIYGSNLNAQQFTSNTTAHSISLIHLMLKRVGSPGTVTVSLRTASAGLSTGLDITTSSLNGNVFSTAYTYQTFTLAVETSILISTQYSIVITAPNGDGSNYVMWQKDSGGGLADAVGNKSTDGGITWASTTPADYLFQVYGNPILDVVSAKQFDSYLVQGDMLFTFEYINLYSTNAGITDPTKYFYFQLLDTDGTTIIAQTVMKAWGDRPGSMYINESLASTLTSGSAFYIKMVGISGSPSDSYQLQSDDWLSEASPLSTHVDNYLLNIYDKVNYEDYSPLDQWIRATANSIDDYYGFSGTTSLTTYIQGKGQVLAANSEGDSIFINGIPSLNYVRPSVFEVVTTELSIDTTTFTNAYNTSADFDTIVGTTISGDMTALGTLFGGMSSQNVMGTLLMVVAVLLALFGLMAVGSGFAPISLFLSMPILFWGSQIRAIDIRLIGLIVFILFFIWVRRYIWVEG